MIQIAIAVINFYNTATGALGKLRVATQNYLATDADTAAIPTVAPANSYFDGRLINPGTMQQSIFSGGRMFGGSAVSYGEMVLANADGNLDYLTRCVFSGHKVEVWIGERQANQTQTLWTKFFDTVMEQADFDWTTVRLRLRSDIQALAKPHQRLRYGGTNTIDPDGLDGLPGDLAGKPKPLVWGKVMNILPPCVNTTKQIYQLHAGYLHSIDAVYDRGVPLTAFGSEYTSQAELRIGSAPPAGYYRVWRESTDTFIRLGAIPTGDVTVDCTEGATPVDRHPGEIFERILYTSQAFLDGRFPFNPAFSIQAEIGIYASHEREYTTVELLDMVAENAGAYWLRQRYLNYIDLRELKDPISNAGVAPYTFSGPDIMSISRVSNKDTVMGVPTWRVRLGYAKQWRVQVDLGNSVPVARRSFAAAEYRRVQSSDSSVLTIAPDSPEVSFDTSIVSQTDAAAEAARRLAILKIPRESYNVRLKVENFQAINTLDVGQMIKLVLPRFNLDAGKVFLVISARPDVRKKIIDVTVWG